MIASRSNKNNQKWQWFTYQEQQLWKIGTHFIYILVNPKNHWWYFPVLVFSCKLVEQKSSENHVSLLSSCCNDGGITSKQHRTSWHHGDVIQSADVCGRGPTWGLLWSREAAESLEVSWDSSMDVPSMRWRRLRVGNWESKALAKGRDWHWPGSQDDWIIVPAGAFCQRQERKLLSLDGVSMISLLAGS